VLEANCYSFTPLGKRRPASDVWNGFWLEVQFLPPPDVGRTPLGNLVSHAWESSEAIGCRHHALCLSFRLRCRRWRGWGLLVLEDHLEIHLQFRSSYRRVYRRLHVIVWQCGGLGDGSCCFGVVSATVRVQGLQSYSWPHHLGVCSPFDF
jgi:hypothetical protein